MTISNIRAALERLVSEIKESGHWLAHTDAFAAARAATLLEQQASLEGEVREFIAQLQSYAGNGTPIRLIPSVVDRAATLLEQQASLEGEVREFIAQLQSYAGNGTPIRLIPSVVDRAATLLEQLAAPAPAVVPISVSERLPGEEDCDAEGRCWLYRPQTPILNPYWDLVRLDYIDPVPPTHWLPAHALPLPAPQGGEVEK